MDLGATAWEKNDWADFAEAAGYCVGELSSARNAPGFFRNGESSRECKAVSGRFRKIRVIVLLFGRGEMKPDCQLELIVVIRISLRMPHTESPETECRYPA